MMKRDLLAVIETATIVEDPDTSQMSVRLPTREEKNLQEEEQEMSHLGEREGVEMIVMNEDPLGEARMRRGKTSHQGATQEEDIKLILVNGSPAPTLTINPTEARSEERRVGKEC